MVKIKDTGDLIVEREKRNITQTEMSRRLGISSAYMSQIEGNKVNFPDHIKQRAEIVLDKHDAMREAELLRQLGGKAPETFYKPQEVKPTPPAEVHTPETEYNRINEQELSIPVPPALVAGVGKDAPTVVNERGGGQSKVLYRFDLLDPRAMFEMTKVLSEGAEKYGADNWRLIDISDHLNHLIIHAYAYMAGDRQDEHLSHALCRAMFALGVSMQTEDDLERATKPKQQEE